MDWLPNGYSGRRAAEDLIRCGVLNAGSALGQMSQTLISCCPPVVPSFECRSRIPNCRSS